MTEDERKARMERALAWGGGTHSIGDVAALIRDNKAQWWSNGDGCIVTEIEQYPRLKAARYWLIFGSLKECLALEDEINEWAVHEGCEVAIASGRKGWGKVAAPTGWRLRGYQFYKPLLGVH
jgi:hypothetical protein